MRTYFFQIYYKQFNTQRKKKKSLFSAKRRKLISMHPRREVSLEGLTRKGGKESVQITRHGRAVLRAIHQYTSTETARHKVEIQISIIRRGVDYFNKCNRNQHLKELLRSAVMTTITNQMGSNETGSEFLILSFTYSLSRCSFAQFINMSSHFKLSFRLFALCRHVW